MQTSKRGALIILTCCIIVLVSYTYYKKQYSIASNTPPVMWHPTPIPQVPINTGTLFVGETKSINGVKITVESISQDSRCPEDVQCIQKGTVNARVILVFPNETKTIDLSLGVSIGFGDYDISITQVTPMKNSKQEIKQGDYRVTFNVHKVSDEEKAKRRVEANQ